MQKPSLLAVATAVFVAALASAFLYTIGFLCVVVAQAMGGGAGDLSGVPGSAAIVLFFAFILATLFNFLIGFPIVFVCWLFGWTGRWTFFIAPALGALILCVMASALPGGLLTNLGIVGFAYFSASIIRMILGQTSESRGASAASARASSAAA